VLINAGYFALGTLSTDRVLNRARGYIPRGLLRGASFVGRPRKCWLFSNHSRVISWTLCHTSTFAKHQ